MPIEIVIPRLGWSMDEGTFVEWLKRDGDVVAVGDAVFALEGEKAVQEIEAIDAGILRIPANGPKEGDVVSVGTVVGYLVAEGDSIADCGLRIAESEENARAKATVSESQDGAITIAQSSSPSNPQSTIHNPQSKSSPRARRIAAELGVDWRTIPGSGRNGRVRERDVRAAAANPQSAIRNPQSALRRTIADRMLASSRNTAPVTITATADATHLVALRMQFQRAPDALGGIVPTYTDLFAKLVAGALRSHPLLNSRWSDEGIVTSAAVHLGIAVDTAAGLLVPVLRNVESLHLKELCRQSAALVERARRRSLAADELRGGTFTLTNLGAYGIDAFTPIINAPECAVLGIGAIARRPAVVEEAVVPRDLVTLSLTFDHRIVDGAPAARFLQTLRDRVETPSPWLLP
jgi:pyruvate dehydrogenase E2 component (dihydrolipoyllysine-residue acetyltransferase)